MWIAFAFGSALFAGITSILAKCGIRKTDSYLATAIRTVVVLLFSWLMVALVGSFDRITEITGRTLVFLILSGLATGASWICYFKALQLGDVNKVVPVDKSSTVMTMLLAAVLLGETLTPVKVLGIVAIGAGTWLMIEKKKAERVPAHDGAGLPETTGKNSWLLFAFLSALFASLTSILGKIGISGVESNLGTAIRTIVVLIMAWVVAIFTGSTKKLKQIDHKELIFILLSGVATGASWLCYYRALQEGPASVVVPIDKLSILVTIAFSFLVFKEKLSARAGIGLVLIVAGTLSMLL